MPVHPAAVKLVRDVLNSEGVAAEIRELLVTDEAMATDLAFSGSPTIRINGQDVVGESSKEKAFALSCRLYPGSAKSASLPLRWCVAPSSRPAKGTRVETGNRHFRIACCDLSSVATISCCLPLGFAAALGAARQVLFSRHYDRGSWAVHRAAWPGILAAASCQAVFDPGPADGNVLLWTALVVVLE